MALTISLLLLQAIQDMMKSHGHEPVNFGDIKVHTYTHMHTMVHVHDVLQDEIYDMVKPAHPLHITLQDLITRYTATCAIECDNNGVSFPQWPGRDSGEHTD